MKSKGSFIGLIALVSTFIGLIHADPLPQSQVSFTAGSGSTWNADWSGVPSRTYFAQGSVDLVNWEYLPVVEFGTGLKGAGVDTTGAPKYFYRLRYVDDTGVANLQQARDADFDNDGIPNWFEVEVEGSDPLDKNSAGGDLDGNGLPDGWERFHFGGLGIADPNGILFPGGLTNEEKSGLGLGPIGDDLTMAGQRIAYTYDGERLNGVNFYTLREFGYTLDGNGNVEATSTD